MKTASACASSLAPPHPNNDDSQNALHLPHEGCTEPSELQPGSDGQPAGNRPHPGCDHSICEHHHSCDARDHCTEHVLANKDNCHPFKLFQQEQASQQARQAAGATMNPCWNLFYAGDKWEGWEPPGGFSSDFDDSIIAGGEGSGEGPGVENAAEHNN